MADPAPTPIGPARNVPSRAVHLMLVVVIAIAFVGLVVGMRQVRPVHEAPDHFVYTERHDPDAIPATSYSNFDRRVAGPNSQWRSILSDLDQPESDAPEYAHRTEAGRRAVLTSRAQRRAFDGAPPVVPHPIDQMNSASCMACHSAGMNIAGVVAPAMSHEFMPNCTQCHVEMRSPDLSDLATARNTFSGLEAPLGGSRAWDGAPPTIPHSTFMRENCMACHGPQGPEPIRTTHPWQTNCLQCHAPSAVLNQGVYQFPD